MAGFRFCSRLLSTSALMVALQATCAQAQTLGIFERHGDVGVVKRPGSATFHSESKEYEIAGGGANMWFDRDAFHFCWKEATGDVSLAADVHFVGSGGNAHRKACLLLRQSLDPDAAYVDAVLHGDGLTSLQCRQQRGGPTREIQSNMAGPLRLKIEKRGRYAFMSVALKGKELHAAGGSFKIDLGDSFLVGLGVCAHDENALEKAIFSNVTFEMLEPGSEGRRSIESTLERIAISSGDRRVVYHAREHFEAPNWTPDGKQLLFNRGGSLYRLPAAGGEPERIPTGFANRINNDHGISPDGKLLVISDQSQERRSLIYLLPFAGGEPRRITPLGPSYWHGWSPDGKTLAYCAERDGEFDVFTIPVEGGAEKRLTTATGLDDGPDYSPDGKHIYFNSERRGSMQIWRMDADGGNQIQITKDEHNNWFPHPSPDGKWIVFLTYEPGVKGHPENQDVMLRLMPAGGGEMRVLANVFGGQGTINVPSWSPDSRHLAFVSYRLVDP